MLQQLDTKRTSSGARSSGFEARSSGSASIPNIQRSINETIGASQNGEDSPVMNETLSVIDEHITDFSTPRHSVAKDRQQTANDSGSEYSDHQDNRLSYIAGPDTDEEDEGRMTVAEVKRWDHKQTAQFLRSIGVEPKHCDIFEEQEITGDILIDMDQAFVHMKEYDFGSAGRRLKTWHKIRGFQEDVKGPFSSVTTYSGYDGSSEDLERSQSRLGQAGLLPRIPSLIDKPGHTYRQSRGQTPTSSHEAVSSAQSGQSPLSPQSTRSQQSAWPPAQGSPVRPSAASVRNMSHSRRHSSMDVSSGPAADLQTRATTLSGKTLGAHKKQSSFDRNWSMTSAAPTMNNANARTPNSLAQALQGELNSSDPSLFANGGAAADLDRGYFSGPETENRRSRNVLRKRDSTGSAVHSRHSRHSSVVEDPKRSATALKRHSRFGSADSIRDLVPMVTSPAAKAYHSNSYKGRFRSASAKTSTSPVTSGATSPTVTNLEGHDASSQGYFGPSPGTDGGQFPTLSSLTSKINASKARRIVGLRAISDAVTGHEKALVASPNSVPSPIKEDFVNSPGRTGSSTPSAASKSLDNDTTDVSSKGTDGPIVMPPPKVPARGKTKSKKQTSAYVRGLQKKTPAEQRVDCDYSGWMKKKSSGMLTTWKPRLFILKGQRLSYYYSEDDTEERGIIDISGHRVLPADGDFATTLHATITGSMTSPVAPQGTQDGVSTDEKAGAMRTKANSDTTFFFKLVPPRSGLSRAVQFTKPTVHFFQVETAAIGRKWMGEIMKATIEHNFISGVETTNKQKTISLTKARARKERPPALKGDGTTDEVVEGPKSDETGLNIRNLSFDQEAEKSLENGLGLGKKSSLEAIGAYISRSTDEPGQEMGSG